ncbi:MAG TPA: hypothetical protein PKK06_00560 [Phycisphaerae bacterium]|nr:hypothetical protein [Phycisphaerae bacterium]HNU43900.1 hypothetical protein [Phycisphaerae bacterium]
MEGEETLVFSITAIVALAVAVVALAVHYAVWGRRRQAAWSPGGTRVRRYGAWDRFVLAVTGVCFLVLVGTGLSGAFSEEGLEEWRLWVHMLAAPGFALGLAAAAVTFAERCRFAPHDAAWLAHGGALFGKQRPLPAGRFDAGQKLFFWLGVTLGFVALVSIMATLVPVFGDEGQEVLAGVHRYSTLALMVVVLGGAYALLLVRRGAWRTLVTGAAEEQYVRYYYPTWWEQLQKQQGHKHGK